MKNKRKIIALIIGVIVLTIVILNVNVIYDNALVLISNHLLSEMSEDAGDDIIDINWGNDLDYRIHYKENNIYLEYRKDNEFLGLLAGVYKYRIENDNLYVLSHNGMAVIDRSGNACVFLNDNNRIESEKITYITSESEFEEIHQKIFDYIDGKIIFKNKI